MSVVEIWLLIDIETFFVNPDDQQIANEGCYCWSKPKNEIYGIIWLPQIIVTKNTKKTHIRNLWEKNDRWYFNLNNDKNKNIILVKYKMVHYVHFPKQSRK